MRSQKTYLSFVSLLLLYAMMLTLTLGGCGKKETGDSINWNIGGSSQSGIESGKEESGNVSETDATVSGQTGDGSGGEVNKTSGQNGNNHSGTGSATNTTSKNDSNSSTTSSGAGTIKATYYVDSVNGSDSNIGTSESKPFKTLNKVPHSKLAPGSKVLLKAGSHFKESLGLSSSGSASAPIVYDKYGQGAKPVIDGGGDFTVIELRNVQYIELRNLEIVNDGKGGNIMRGITLTSGGRKHNGGKLSHIYFLNLDIHKINAKVGRGSAGIYIENGESINPCWYDDLRIEGCNIYDTGACGIIINSQYGKRSETPNWDLQPLPFKPSTNVVIKNNTIRDLPADGMWISTTKGAVLEYNTVYNTGYGTNTAYAGIWPHNSDDCIVQYNEVYNNRMGGGDGQGLDVDINCNNTIVQYNYSHDNEGGFILICTDGEKDNYNKNTTVRYNISQNDLHGLVTIKGISVTGAKIYNNTFYTNKGYSNGTIDCLLWSSNDAVFTNNIFINNGTSSNGSYSKFVDNKDGNGSSTSNAKLVMTFENNVFSGTATTIAPTAEGNIKVGSSNKIGTDPALANPGTGSKGRNTLSGYKLKSNSPCKGSGKTISGNGGKDFFGNNVSGTPSIGAHQG